ncbi:RNA-binding protein 4.1-like [Styela clava]
MVKIFVGRLVDSVTKEKLESLFSPFGEVLDCVVLKNFAFVHMADKKDAERAIGELDKSDLEGQAINVEISVTKVASAAKLFVGNLAEGTKSSELHKLFQKHGTVIECEVIKNFAFVHMSRESQAREAISELNDYELNGNKIRVQMARQKGGGERSGGRGGRGDGYRGSQGYGHGGRYNPYGYDSYDMPRSRNYPPVDRMPLDGGMRRDAAFGARRGGPSYMRLLRQRAMLARRLMEQREYGDGYSGMGSRSGAYRDYADDLSAFDDGLGSLDSYGGGASAYGSYY